MLDRRKLQESCTPAGKYDPRHLFRDGIALRATDARLDPIQIKESHQCVRGFLGIDAIHQRFSTFNAPSVAGQQCGDVKRSGDVKGKDLLRHVDSLVWTKLRQHGWSAAFRERFFWGSARLTRFTAALLA